jgi:hypothetical protein
MRVELLAVISDDPGSFLTAMLERVHPERRERRGIGVTIDPEYAAFFVEMIGVQGHPAILVSEPVT